MIDIAFVRIQRYDTPDVHAYAAVRRDDLAAVLAASDRVETVQEWDPGLPPEIIATCRQQYAAWKTGPAKAAAKKMIADLKKIQSAADAEDIPEMNSALKAAGNDAAGLEAFAVPTCADPAGYWRKILIDVKSGGDNAGAASGFGGMILALAPLKKAPALETKLGAELKRTTAR